MCVCGEIKSDKCYLVNDFASESAEEKPIVAEKELKRRLDS